MNQLKVYRKHTHLANMSLSNGFPYTDSYGIFTLPYYANRETLEYADSLVGLDRQKSICDCCSSDACPLRQCEYRCILCPKSFMNSAGYLGMYDYGGPVFTVSEVACSAIFNLCDKCKRRSESILNASDHLAEGENWDDLLAFLRSKITNETLWSRWEGGDIIISKESEKVMSILHQGITGEGETGPFSKLPYDILYIMDPYIKEHTLYKFVTKIQSLWRGYRVRAFSAPKRWFLGMLGKTIHQSRTEMMWAECDDCGMKRRTQDLQICTACADPAGCCFKVVCDKACCYACPACGDTNIVKSVHKKMDGSPSFFDCLCGTTFLLNEVWWGPSETEYARRYD